MSKIAIVGCDASGKTVFVSALTDYFKSGQRIGQACALIPADTVTRRYTDKLHHTMRILHQWPAANEIHDSGVHKMKWTMMKDGKPLIDLEMLDYGGENFRFAFRDDGTTRNAAIVEGLVNYIAEADFIVITVGLDNMIRKLAPEIYREMEGGNEAYDLDSEAQWITNGLLKLVKAKLAMNPPGVVVALTQADKYRDKLAEYGGAKALFARCWADIDMMYPDLNVVAVASVDKLTAGGFPADDYKTDGVLTVMKEFSRYAFGDCDEVTTRLRSLSDRLCKMTDVGTPVDFSEAMSQYESAMKDLHDKTAIVQELYKEDFQKNERFLTRCKLFAEALKEIERRPLESQVSADYWNEQLRLFPEMEGTIRGVARYYQRKVEQIRAEEQRKEQARQAAIRKQEEDARRAEAERQRQIRIQEEERQRQARIAEEQRIATEKREEEERERRRRIQEEQERNRQRREEEEKRELELQRLKAEEEKARIERESVERRDKTRAFLIRAATITIVLVIAISGGVAYVLDQQAKAKAERDQRAMEKMSQEERIAFQTEKDRAARAKADAEKARAEADRAKAASDRVIAETEKAKADAEKAKADADKVRVDAETKLRLAEQAAKVERERRLADEEAAQRKRDEEDRISQQNEAKMVADLIVELGDAVSSDTLDRSRELIAKLRKAKVTPHQRGVINLCATFCDKLERAQNGDSDSQLWIATQHKLQDSTIKKDTARAIEWYEKAADNGNSEAMYWLGDCAEKGIGREKNETAAVNWYSRSAQAKNGDAMYRLGYFYSKGLMGLNRSTEKAHELFMQAKANGCSLKNVDEWIRNTKPKNSGSFWSGGDDLDALLKDLESETRGR